MPVARPSSVPGRLAAVERGLAAVEKQLRDAPAPTEGIALVVASAERDRLMAALTLATGSASLGCPAHVFFTFWAVAALRRPGSPTRPAGLVDRTLGWLLPRSLEGTALSRLHLCGLGTALLRRRMRERGMPDVEELLRMAGEAGVSIRVCTPSLELLGLRMADLVDYPDLAECGVATFLERAMSSRAAMFI